MEFIRGDSQPFKFRITKMNGDNVDLSEIDTLIMTCRKHNNKDSEILFSKVKSDFTFSDNFYHSIINPVDTESLNYGVYNFDIECTLTNGYRKTLKSQFTITEEDTIHEVM